MSNVPVTVLDGTTDSITTSSLASGVAFAISPGASSAYESQAFGVSFTAEICRREARERIGLQHAYLRGTGLREVKPALVAEEPRVGAGLPENGGVECFDFVGECARHEEKSARNWNEALHGVIVPRMPPNLCRSTLLARGTML